MVRGRAAMRISTRARYALRMMLDIARHDGENDPVSLTSVSERTHISKSYLEQVALSLRSASLLRGVSGRRGGYHLAVPAVDVHTIGAGGGTIASIDEGGLLHVGPRGAGADPGPACYGKGGIEPTVTDAHLVLGRLRPGPPRPR